MVEICNSFVRLIEVLQSYSSHHLLSVIPLRDSGFVLYTKSDGTGEDALFIRYSNIEVFDVGEDYLFLLLSNGIRVFLANDSDECKVVFSMNEYY